MNGIKYSAFHWYIKCINICIYIYMHRYVAYIQITPTITDVIYQLVISIIILAIVIIGIPQEILRNFKSPTFYLLKPQTLRVCFSSWKISLCYKHLKIIWVKVFKMSDFKINIVCLRFSFGTKYFGLSTSKYFWIVSV